MKNIFKHIIIFYFSLSLLFNCCFFYKHIKLVSFGVEPVLNLVNNDSEYELLLKTQTGFDKTAKSTTPVQHFFAWDKNIRTIPAELTLTRYKNFNNLSFNIPIPAYKIPVSSKTEDG
ncbi:MAG TPA: hypothetical protein PLI87_04435 [bacterium]|nr:hypothetical protein [bacterium]